MPVSDEDVRRVETLAEHLLHAGEVLDTVRELWAENADLRRRSEDLTARLVATVQAYGRSRELVRTIDGIIKNPYFGGRRSVQVNYEDQLQPELRALHARIMESN